MMMTADPGSGRSLAAQRSPNAGAAGGPARYRRRRTTGLSLHRTLCYILIQSVTVYIYVKSGLQRPVCSSSFIS